MCCVSLPDSFRFVVIYYVFVSFSLAAFQTKNYILRSSNFRCECCLATVFKRSASSSIISIQNSDFSFSSIFSIKTTKFVSLKHTSLPFVILIFGSCEMEIKIESCFFCTLFAIFSNMFRNRHLKFVQTLNEISFKVLKTR